LGPRNTNRKLPPTFSSTAQATSEHPPCPHQHCNNAGREHAQKSRGRVARETGVDTISRSEGVVTFNDPVFFTGSLL